MTAAGGSSLSYNIFADPKLSQIWGDGFHVNGPTVSIPGGLRPLRIPIYAAIPPRQFVAMGSYGDELFVTLNF